MADSKKVLDVNFAVGCLPASDVVRVKVPERDLRGWLSVLIGALLDGPCCPVAVDGDVWFDLTCYLATSLAFVMVNK